MTKIESDISKLSSLSSSLKNLNDDLKNKIDYVYDTIEKLPNDGSWVGKDAQEYILLKKDGKQDLEDFIRSFNKFISSIDYSVEKCDSSISKVRKN